MNWMTESPFILLLVIALVAFLESFALLGILVPGVVLLFSLAALANTAGISPFSLMVSGGIGALIGDFTSFFIGLKLKHHLLEWRWFARHKSWIDQGEWFIHRWGWLSVILGRFLGPLRPVIPLVSGTLGMPAKQFLPLSALTVVFWAPAYLLPGFYTGEISELWQLQPLSTRSLSMYALTAVAIAGTTLAIYHHTHPEQMHLKGWLTRHQADRWPIPSLTLTFISLIAFLVLWLLSPLDQDLVFLDWSVEWKSQNITKLWHAVASLTNASIVYLEFILLVFWLFLSSRIALAFISTIAFSMLTLTSTLFSVHFLNEVQASAFLEISTFTFTTGFLANLVNSRKHGLRRWPVYLVASQVMVVGIISHLWEGSLMLSACGLALFLALLFNGVLRAAWQGLHLPLKTWNAHTILILILLINSALALLSL